MPARDPHAVSSGRERTFVAAETQELEAHAIDGMPVTEETVLSFVRSSIKSAWALELLLLVRRDPQRSWRLESLVRELRGSLALVKENLKTLSEIGLVVLIDDEACLYKPKSAELDDLVSGLVDLYAQKPITVLRTIFTSPSDKIKSFSDAFLLRRSDNE